MDLKEARAMANECRGTLMVDDSSVHATVILDDRIKELEKQRDELLTVLKNLCDYIEPIKNIYNTQNIGQLG